MADCLQPGLNVWRNLRLRVDGDEKQHRDCGAMKQPVHRTLPG
jgi:hypothetical protein